MKYLLLLLLTVTSTSLADYGFEKSKFKEGRICPEMVGIWFTDVTVKNTKSGLKRDVTRLERSKDGTAKLKGLTFYLDEDKVTDWEFETRWSCDGEWYVESNQWGYTAFKVVSFNSDQIVLFDKLNNLKAPKPGNITELRRLSDHDRLKENATIAAFLKLE